MSTYSVGDIINWAISDRYGNVISSWENPSKNVKIIKEEINMEEKLNNYLEENNIEVDENGNFEMYVVVDADDKDHEVGSVFHGETREVYAEDRAYEDLEENKKVGCSISTNEWIKVFNNLYNTPSNKGIKKKTSIREELLTMKDKMFKVLVNKENVVNVREGLKIVYVNKYKVIKPIELNPILKFKIGHFTDEGVAILLYNNLTKKSKTIKLIYYVETLGQIRELINDYLKENEKEVALINSIVDDGAEL